MARKARRTLDDGFKVKVVLEAHKEGMTIGELGSKYEVHPNQISKWKKEFLEGAKMAFSGDTTSKKEVEELKKEN